MSIPPIAIVRVRPMMDEKNVFTPSAAIPRLLLFVVYRYPIAAAFVSNNAKFIGCLPGSRSGSDLTRPAD